MFFDTATSTCPVTLWQGTLRVNRYNTYEGWVASESVGQDILISGRVDMNRAFDGDAVAVELLPEEQWTSPAGATLCLVLTSVRQARSHCAAPIPSYPGVRRSSHKCYLLPCRTAAGERTGRRHSAAGGGPRCRGRGRRPHCRGLPAASLAALRWAAAQVCACHERALLLWPSCPLVLLPGCRSCRMRAARLWSAAQPSGQQDGSWVSSAATGALAATQASISTAPLHMPACITSCPLT